MKNPFRRGRYLLFCLEKQLEVKNTYNGKGVFSLEYIEQGEMILHLGGPIFCGKEIPFLSEPINDYFLQIDEDAYLGPSGELDDYINHSCDPNTGLVFQKNGIGLISITAIPAGREITYDYSTTMDGFWGEMTCNCGSAICRRRIVNFLDIPEDTQQRYSDLGILPPYILRKRNQSLEEARVFSAFDGKVPLARLRGRKLPRRGPRAL